MDTYLDRIITTDFDCSYEIKEFMLNILIDMGMANQDTCWTKNNNGIYILVTDQMDIALAQRNAKPTYLIEFYSKIPLREDGPTRYILGGAIQSIRTKFMHPDMHHY